MTVNRMIDLLNVKISGLHTLVCEYAMTMDSFRRKPNHKFIIWQVEYPEETRREIFRTNHDVFAYAEADVVEFLFNVIITEEYKKWKNYKLTSMN